MIINIMFAMILVFIVNLGIFLYAVEKDKTKQVKIFGILTVLSMVMFFGFVKNPGVQKRGEAEWIAKQMSKSGIEVTVEDVLFHFQETEE